jgi:malate synthase
MNINKNIDTNNKIFTDEAVKFVEELLYEFSGEREILLKKREENYLNNVIPDFLEETKHIREDNWVIDNIPNDLLERTIEITGPSNRKMMINALNSEANCYMCDIEDSSSPTWNNIVNGFINLKDYVNDELEFYDQKKNKNYKIKSNNNTTLFIRPRGWHLHEKNVTIKGKTVSASIFDFGFCFFHMAKKLIEKGSGPYYYLPKMESYKEARLWNNIFTFSENYFDIPHGTIKATCLIEHINAAFQMDEILYELRDHCAGLNCGRWDYIFSVIKVLRNNKNISLPDRKNLTMNTHFMKSYVKLLVETCHKRNIHAMGGMAAQIPSKNEEINKLNLNKVYNDKKTEASEGMDGTWIAHPGLYQSAYDGFVENKIINTVNQISIKKNYNIKKEDLLKMPKGEITMNGLNINVHAYVKYLESWLNGVGAVAINSAMEDAATAEISRMQLWQWKNNKVKIDNKIINLEMIMQIVDKETNNSLVKNLIRNDLELNLPNQFLTLEAYKLI